MTDASVRPFSLPLRSPLATARGTIDRREGFLLRVEDGDHVGVGEATPLPGWTESREACRRALDAACEALRADGLETEFDEVDSELGDAELGPAARHAVTLACADLAARRADRPLYRELGGTRRVESVPVNATVGDADAGETALAAESAADAGFDCVKVKVGSRSVSADVERLRAVREVVGLDVELRADANGAWSRSQAREAFDALVDLDVRYVEQPLPADDLAGHADLRGEPVGVALDESLAAHGVADVLAAGAADALVLKPMALGGVTVAHDGVVRAEQAGVTPVVTTTIDAVVARTAAVHVAATVDDPVAMGLATADRLAEDLAPDPAPVADGRVVVQRAKGNGVAACRWR